MKKILLSLFLLVAPVAHAENPSAYGGTGASIRYMLDLASGRIPGLLGRHIFGSNPDIDSGVGYETIWDGGGTYTPPTQARIHDIVSTSANDAGVVVSSGTMTSGNLSRVTDSSATFITDGVAIGDYVINDTKLLVGIVTSIDSETQLSLAAKIRNPVDGSIDDGSKSGDSYRIISNGSTGASFIYLSGLNAFFAEISEFIVLNGLTNVPTTNAYIRQFEAREFGPNTTGAAGVITSTAQVDGTVSCQILVGNNQSLSSVYTIPLNKRGYLSRWWVSIINKTQAASTLRLRVGDLHGISYIIDKVGLNSNGSSSYFGERPILKQLAPGIDIWVEADSDSNNIQIASGFDIILEDL